MGRSLTDSNADLALHPAWLPVIDDVAKQILGARDRTGAALIEEVRALSQLYTRERDALSRQADPIAARLRFFVPRDLPKIQSPLADLARQDLLPPGPVWRVLDLGAGLGTTTLGTAVAAHKAGIERLEVTAVERDAISVRLLRALTERCGHGPLQHVASPVDLTAVQGDIRTLRPQGPFDLIVIGLALNELFTDGNTVHRRAEWLRGLLSLLSPHGSLVVVEPALRHTSRQLQQVREVLEQQGQAITSPCTHAAPCPLLERDRDWCHQDLRVPLPAPLQAIARGAGLRFERLTWAHLVLRQDGRRTAPHHQRIVGGPIRTKGRTEWTLCGPCGASRLAQLTRHVASDPVLDQATRGDVMWVEPQPERDARLRSDRVSITHGVRAHSESLSDQS